MSRLFVLLALAVVPATSFGQDWFQADRHVALPGSGISGPAQPAFDLPRSQSADHRFRVGGRPDVSASRNSLGWSSLFNEPADAELGNPLATASWLASLEDSHGVRPAFDFASSGELVIRGQSPSGGGSGGSEGGGGAAVVISRAIPKWIVGGLVEVPFSLESDASAVQMHGIALRLLPNEWFIGWGDQILKFDDQNGGYDIPLSLQFGKVVKIGETPMKLFVEPIDTPPGLRSGPGGAEWGIKLNMTILFPEAKFDAPLLSGRGGGHCCR